MSVDQLEATDRTFRERHLCSVFIDGVQHSLVWIRGLVDGASAVIDRPPSKTGEPTRLLALLVSSEGASAVEALVADYEENYVRRSPQKRIVPAVFDIAELAFLSGRVR